MASILDGLGLEGSVLDGLDDWPQSASRKEWFAITRGLIQQRLWLQSEVDNVGAG